MAVTFVLLFNKIVLGGLTFHEFAGLTLSLAFLIHILLNWKWVKTISLRILDRRLPNKTRFSYCLNLLLLLSMTFIIVSGILISRIVFPNINIGNEQWFKMAHISVSFLVLIIVSIHVGLHWQWVVTVWNKVFKMKTPNLMRSISVKTAVAALLLFGGYEMYSTGFFAKMSGVGNLFNTTSAHMPAGKGELGFTHNGDARPQFASGAINSIAGGRPSMPDHAGMQGDRFQSTNVFSVILQYFSIMSVFIVFVYYLGKCKSRRN
jgi:hypothetical protein